MAANNNAVRVVPDFIPNSSWVRAETKNVQLPNHEQAVWDVLQMVFPDKRYYTVRPRKVGAIFMQFFYADSAKTVHSHVWGSSP